jgi:putative spermidine/putrescine transport system substrate-binding protein
MMDRRHFAKTVLAFACGLAAVPASAAETLTLMAYTGLFQDRYTQAVLAPFEKANPDIKIVYAPQPSSGAMIGQLRAQKAAPQVDVVIMDVSVAKAGADEGLFVKLEAKDLPVIDELYPNARIPEIAGVAVTFDNLVLIYNTEAWPVPPKSIADMAAPAVKGKVVIPGIPDIQGMSLVAILDKKNGGPGVEGKFAKGIEAMEAIAPNVQTWEPKPEVYAPVIAGQASIGVGWNARAQVNTDTSGGKMKAVIPAEGTAFQINTINLVQGAPQSAAARKFIAYALSAEAQKSFTETMFYAPTNAKAQIAPAAIDRTVVKSLDKVVPIDWLAVAKVRDQVAEAWRRKVIPLSR